MDFLADGLRMVTLVTGSAVVSVTVVVTWVYFRIWQRFHRHLSANAKWRGLLPRHVFLIGVSYLLLAGLVGYEVMTRIRSDLTWLAPLALLAYALGLWALWDVLGSSRHRYHNLRLTIGHIPDDADVEDTDPSRSSPNA